MAAVRRKNGVNPFVLPSPWRQIVLYRLLGNIRYVWARVELTRLGGHQHGWSVSNLARGFGLSRTTVYRELVSPAARTYSSSCCPTDFTAAQVIYLEQRLVVCPSIRGTDLHAELRHHYQYEGSYPAFQRHLRALRPAVVRDPEIRFETGPGEQTNADWAELGPWPLGTEMVELSAMVTILGNSGAPTVRFATDRTRETSLDRVFGARTTSVE